MKEKLERKDNMDKEERAGKEQFITDKMPIPKFCTNISFAATSAGNIVMTTIYTDEGDSKFVIDRVLIEAEHAKNIVKTLQNVIEKVEEMEND